MKSRTSFCNAHVLKKDITRFAPLWAVYTVFLAVLIFNNSTAMIQSAGTAQVAYSISQNMKNVQFLFCIYGFGCATLLFGDLFRTRMAGGLHAMPLRRETWFGTHVLAGILFAAVPNAVLAVIMAIVLQNYAFVAGLWWLAVTGQFLFHFALAVLCVQLSGNLLGHAATFGTIEFFSMIVYSVYGSVYEPMLYGIVTESKPFKFFSPAQWWSSNNWLEWDVQTAEMANDVVSIYSSEQYISGTPALTQTRYIYEGIITAEWIYLAVCALLAVAFLALALIMYRRRKLECAGDFITSKVMGWVFLILGSVCAAVIVPVVGFAIAFFGILMLWERTLKVFRKKNLIAFGISAAAVLLTIGLTFFDVGGITTRVPELSQVESVTLNPEWGINSVVLTEPEDIIAVMDAHEHALSDRDPEEGNWYNLDLEYTLSDGSTLRRDYYLNAEVPAMEGIKKILSRWEMVFDGADYRAVVGDIERVTIYTEYYDDDGLYIGSGEKVIPGDACDELFIAIYQDCKEGDMAQNSAFHEGESVYLTFWYAEDSQLAPVRQNLWVFEDSTHTNAFLEQYLQPEK